MSDFPRTVIEGLSVSRLMIGTNWFLGFSHCSKAKDREIVETMTPGRIADILEVFLNEGVDTLYGIIDRPALIDGIEEAQQRTGRKLIKLAIPSLLVGTHVDDFGGVEKKLDECVRLGVDICMPHQNTTDAFVDRNAKSVKGIGPYLELIRQRGMVPGLSTHMPETIGYADADGLDIATYIQIYNAAGFLMQIEADWVQRVIWNAKKPVITIKPLAAGKLPPLVGLAFAWSTIRKQDMVCVGTYSPYEAAEVIELSRSVIEGRLPDVELQKTRSKETLD